MGLLVTSVVEERADAAASQGEKVLNKFTADLPLPLTSFIGREEELAEIKRLLTTTRLLTLTGAGGCGKTRLALEMAHTSAPEFQDGITWVDLAPLSNPELVVPAVAVALQVREQPDQPLIETLTSLLATRQLLLVLDNCEHLLSACGPLTNSLLRVCAEVQVLATSREPLGTSRETVFLVPPLALPQAPTEHAARDSEAVRLFALRAAESLPSFVLTPESVQPAVRVCERLDGLPLAIELAAARVKMLTVSEIAERLDDRFRLLTRSPAATLARHQTLRAAMDWSYNLLSASEQALLRRLSIFAGGFTLDAAETVCADEKPNAALDQAAILDLLSNLVEKSLVVVVGRVEGMPARYRLLETVREYAQEKLDETRERDSLRTRQLDWCIALGERGSPELNRADQAVWFARFDAERDNFRAVQRWAIESGGLEAGLLLANALWRYWEIRGHYSEGRNWYEELLAHAGEAVRVNVRARATFCLAGLMYRQGDLNGAISVAKRSLVLYQQLGEAAIGMASVVNLLGVIEADRASFQGALEFYERALVLHRQEGNALAVSGVLHNLGYAAHMQGDLARAAHYLQESAAVKRQLVDPGGLALTLNVLGEIESDRAHYDRAESYFQESLVLYREIGGKMGMTNTLNNLGVAAYHQGKYRDALALLNESSQVASEIGSKRDMAITQLNLGDVAHAQGEADHARAHYEQALALYHEIGEKEGSALTSDSLAALLLDTGDLERAATLQHAALQLYSEIGNKRFIALALEGSAGITAQHGEPAHAAQFLGAASALRQEMGTPLHLPERPRVERAEAQARAALGDRTFEAAFERGRTLAIDETVQAALTLTRTQQTQVETEARPELEIFGLGQSIVEWHGKPLASSDWKYLKSKELFFYLLSHPQATKAQIGLDLWTDESPAQLRRAFHRTLHFARKALRRPEWITFEDDVYAVKGELKYAYDVELFERHLAQARGWQRGDRQARGRAMEELEAAVELYRGDFLPDLEGGDWILFRREALRKQFLDALLTLGQSFFDQQQYEQAAAAYQRVLTHDNYLELAHRELMRCLARQGEVGQALRHYQTLTELLRREVGAPPSPQTKAVYERLKRGESV
ncbi:Putative HTH-type transcriptional regulator [Thermoflexales bacterium]|nr:Putative HTH-type transcriptional regulator [Thermoflexales bacterium]